MQQDEWVIIDKLEDECMQQEKAETFFPLFKWCGVCKGYIFGGKGESDVQRQFACCGCVVALEMEMRDAGLRAPPMQPEILDKLSARAVARKEARLAEAKAAAQSRLLERLLALDAKGTNTKAAMAYTLRLKRGAARLHERNGKGGALAPCSRQAMTMPRGLSRQAMMMPKDKRVCAK